MDWRNIIDNIYLWYNEFLDWYLVQPIYGQILAIIGIIALLALAVTLIYYVIKGIAYLIFYTLKGIYYLLKGIGLGIFKLCKGFYNLVSGEYKSKKQIYNNNIHIENQFTQINRNTLYCKECGKGFSEKMMKKIFAHGNVFCVNCGKEYTLAELPRLIIPAH
ncbi:MAG: hypothetical protein ACFE94_16355 [Candidatus Hodarchaeota archaeon]